MDYSQCPIHNPRVGNDPDTDVFLSNIGIEPEQKLVAFLTICILVRLALAGLTHMYHDRDFTPYVAGIIAIVAIVTLGTNLNKSQWWSRKGHLVIATLILVAAISQIYTGERDKAIAYLLYADVLFGFATFSYVYLTCPQY
jgi:cation transport ATPase